MVPRHDNDQRIYGGKLVPLSRLCAFKQSPLVSFDHRPDLHRYDHRPYVQKTLLEDYHIHYSIIRNLVLPEDACLAALRIIPPLLACFRRRTIFIPLVKK